jgi:hypothetical protein
MFLYSAGAGAWAAILRSLKCEVRIVWFGDVFAGVNFA